MTGTELLARVGAAKKALAGVFGLRDVHFYGGLAVAIAGGWRLSHAWTLVAAGLVLMFVGLRRPR
jgi:hypothetical protein